MELTVYENRAPVGKLRIRSQGLYTLFEARLPPGPELSRLWLLGAGRRWSLGLLEPRDDGRFLRRRLTRLQMASLPPRIDTALTLPADAPPPGVSPPPLPLRRDSATDPARRTPEPGSPWQRRPDGSLIDPARRLLALPCAPGAAPAAARKITLDGREYWLFRY